MASIALLNQSPTSSHSQGGKGLGNVFKKNKKLWMYGGIGAAVLGVVTLVYRKYQQNQQAAQDATVQLAGYPTYQGQDPNAGTPSVSPDVLSQSIAAMQNYVDTNLQNAMNQVTSNERQLQQDLYAQLSDFQAQIEQELSRPQTPQPTTNLAPQYANQYTQTMTYLQSYRIPTVEETGLDNTRLGTDNLTDYTRFVKSQVIANGGVTATDALNRYVMSGGQDTGGWLAGDLQDMLSVQHQTQPLTVTTPTPNREAIQAQIQKLGQQYMAYFNAHPNLKNMANPTAADPYLNSLHQQAENLRKLLQ